MMTLAKYQRLIVNLPYLDQAFETKKAIWNQERYLSNEPFSSFFSEVFQEDTAKFSRADLFSACTKGVDNAIFSIILWGYPRNMRGNSFSLILDSLPVVTKALSCKKELDKGSFDSMIMQLEKTRVGLSTLSKFLYFFNFKIENHRCLIFDSRIIEVLNGRVFAELGSLDNINAYNKTKKYLDYLALLERISGENGYSEDQLEYFLFAFGKNLKISDERCECTLQK